jgi:catechol 2,3-dioxygenase-like lactoylglutathione lyase family enzyme
VRIRQVALVARELEPAVDALRSVLGIEVAYRDPGVGVFGLENAVLPVGDTFLEVVCPAREDTSAGRFLARRGGDGGYMVILQSDDLAKDRRRVEELGVRIVWETALDDIATIHLHPRDVGGAILSLDEARPPESWRWAGPDWRAKIRSDVVTGIAGVELQARDPAALAARWSRLLARPVTDADDGLPAIVLESGTLRFAQEQDGRGEGISGVDFAAVDPARALDAARERGLAVAGAAVALCGIQLRFVDAVGGS